jgi:hypothetical protein
MPLPQVVHVPSAQGNAAGVSSSSSSSALLSASLEVGDDFLACAVTGSRASLALAPQPTKESKSAPPRAAILRAIR